LSVLLLSAIHLCYIKFTKGKEAIVIPNFADPFTANVPRKMTREELIQAIRLDIAGKLEAIYLYDAHFQATDDLRAKAVLEDIRDEEKIHMGELITLLRTLDPMEAQQFLKGQKEVEKMLEEIKK
jgi:uncharacterized protein